MKRKIGIPRALLNHKFLPLWQTFFQSLDLETVVSPKTNKKILQDGLRHTIDEACVPVKLFSGHVIYLRDKVDCMFVPRMASVEKGNFICCKFLGLPDVIRSSIPDLPPVVTADVDLNRRSWRHSMYELGFNFTKNLFTIEKAFRNAWNAQKNSGSACCEINNGKELTIGLLAHSYNIYDRYANMDIISKLENLGARIVTPDMLPEEVIRSEGRELSSELYWTYGREIVGAASYLAGGKADGIILLTSFGCGPDSLIAELIIRKLKHKVPIMSIVFDEETGEAGLLTRLESFVDMVKRIK